mgnify:CR=1 FL=1
MNSGGWDNQGQPRRIPNEPIRRGDNAQAPQNGAAVAQQPPLVPPGFQGHGIFDRNDLVTLIQEVCGHLAQGVQTPVYKKPYP